MAIPKSCELIDTFFTGPDGKQYRVTNMRKFCREHGLSPGNLYKVYIGTRRHHKGFQCHEAGYQRVYAGVPCNDRP